MNSRERVLSAAARRGYDRIPIKHEGTPEVNRMLMDHFGLTNMEQLLRVVGDDFRYVEPLYCGPELRTFPDGSIEGYFGERYKYAEFESGKYLEACYLPFAGVNSLEDLDRSHFPQADWFDYATIRQQAERLRGQGFAVCCGTAGDIDLINGISRARGMEQVLMDLVDDNPVYLEIMQARFDFYYQYARADFGGGRGAGGLYAHWRGPGQPARADDQHGRVRKTLRSEVRPVFPDGSRLRRRTMMHMCGCVEKFLPRLIELGLDVYDVVQPTTPAMDIAALAARFGDRLTFCGSMCVQTTLAWGTPEDVPREVRRRLEIVPRRRAVPRPDTRHPGPLSAGEHSRHVPHGRQPLRGDRPIHPGD